MTVKHFLTKDLDTCEYNSYKDYLNGDIDSTLWIYKVSKRRDLILFKNPRCIQCNSWVSIKESGECVCSNNHNCNTYINSIIKEIEKEFYNYVKIQSKIQSKINKDEYKYNE